MATVTAFHHPYPEYCLHAPAIFEAAPKYPPEYAAFGLLLSFLRHTREAPFFCRLNGLTVNNSSTGLQGATQFQTQIVPQDRMNLFPSAIQRPGPVIFIYRLVRREIMGQVLPNTAVFNPIQNRIHD